MTYKEVATMLGTISVGNTPVPFAYYSFSEATAKEPPFICFYFSDSSDMAADDTNYQRIRRLNIELYTDNKDFALEETVEGVLNNCGLVYDRYESYIETEKMFMVVYSTDIIIKDEPPVEAQEGNNNG